MKNKFSKSWKSSSKARKQRKYRFNAPINLARKLMSSNLSKELRKSYKKRSLPIKKGDNVRIMRGEFKGKKGKILSVERYHKKVYIEGMQRTKKDGTKVNVPFEPSNIQIIELNTDDKKRIGERK